MYRVTLVQRVLPHYRICFIRSLQARLWERGIDFRLIYGQERAGTVPRTVRLHEPWAHHVTNRYANIGNTELVWQHCLRAIGRSDLVIVEQSNRLLINYWLQARRLWSGARLGFWGHGRNFQSVAPDSLRERWKRVLLRHVDWWFAYTEATREILSKQRFPADRVTAVNNAVDDETLRPAVAALMDREPRAVAASLGCKGRHVALYCGALHEGKRIEFLLQAAHAIKTSLPDFELLVVGDGPLRGRVEQAAAADSWIRYAGMKTGVDLAPFLRASQVLLMPGPVGLVMLDSFIGACPLITTNISRHGPEIAYLRSGVNGLMTRDDIQAFAAGTVECLRSPARLRMLRKGCRDSAQRYSMRAMVENFAEGIEQCVTRR